VLFAADFSKVSARNQQETSKEIAGEQQGNSKETARKFWGKVCFPPGSECVVAHVRAWSRLRPADAQV